MRIEIRSNPGRAIVATMMLALICLAQPQTSAAAAQAQPVGLADKPLAAHQVKLLDLAIGTATRIPVQPHIKDRSKAQEAVVAGCLELDQPARALDYLGRIDDWRKGACYADLAFYCARREIGVDVDEFLKKADQISKTTEDWRRDTIRVKIGRTHAVIGNTKLADLYTSGVVESETGKIAGARAMLGDAGSFDAQMRELDALVAKGNYDITRNALEAYAQLFKRHYADAARREKTEQAIKAGWDKTPIALRIDLLQELAGFAIGRRDTAKALALTGEARKLQDSFEWPSEYHVPMKAKLAGLLFKAGDPKGARAEADAARALFDAQREKIVNIWRAGALRPLAEAYQAMGDTATALEIYRMAVEAGMENPNSRPRAEDLAATCSSMAVHGVEPDARLMTRMIQINEGLGQPW